MGLFAQTDQIRVKRMIASESPWVDVTSPVYGAVADDDVDDTAAIQAAADYAIASGYDTVFIPTGTYIVSATVNLGRMRLIGNGRGSVIRSTITDGSAVLSFASGANYFSVEGIRIDSDVDGDEFIAGTADGQNCIGIKIISSGGTYSARYFMRDVIVYGLKTGYDINGFIGTLDNVWAVDCETGLVGTNLNSTRLHLRFENNRTDFVITSSNGIHFDQYISEGGAFQSGVATSTIDGCLGVTFTTAYFEQKRNVPFITFGATSEVSSLSLQNILVSMANDASSDYDIYPLAFDKVDGLNISGYFATGYHDNRYSTTTSTKNIVDNTSHANNDNYGPHDASLNMGVVRNYFPNPNFDLWFRGWPAVIVTRATMSQETTLVRRGQNAVRLTLDAAQSNGYITWLFNDSYLGPKLAGKTVTVYSWIWIPDTDDFDPNDLGAQAVEAYISVYTDGTDGGTTNGGTSHTVRGAWNLMRTTASVPADATRIDVSVYMAMYSGTSAGDEYCVIDSMYIVEGSGQDVAVVNGWIADSDLIQTRSIGGLMYSRNDSAPTDTDQIYEVGDKTEKITAATNDTMGWICTTAGAGGTAVFTPYDLIVNYATFNLESDGDLTVRNSADQQILWNWRPGSTVQQDIVFRFSDISNYTQWSMIPKSAGNEFQLQKGAGTIRFRGQTINTQINAEGVGAVLLNMGGSANSGGSGGTLFGDGSGTQVASISGDGVGSFASAILGTSGTSAGSSKFYNATSGSVTIQTVAGALGTQTFSLPADTGTACVIKNPTALTEATDIVAFDFSAQSTACSPSWTFAPAGGDGFTLGEITNCAAAKRGLIVITNSALGAETLTYNGTYWTIPEVLDTGELSPGADEITFIGFVCTSATHARVVSVIRDTEPTP